MVADLVENIYLYSGLGQRILLGLNYLRNTNLINLADGKYEIDGQRVYASINSYQTKEYEISRWEAHKKYIDIQCLIKGTEKIFFAPVSKMDEVSIPYNTLKDIMFFKGTGNYVTMFPGKFMILFPTDSHQPSIISDIAEFVKKVVIKVEYQL